jgi:hypothetical protein
VYEGSGDGTCETTARIGEAAKGVKQSVLSEVIRGKQKESARFP